MSMSLSIHGCPSATVQGAEERVWIEIRDRTGVLAVTLFIRCPDARRHAHAIADALNAAHAAEQGK